MTALQAKIGSAAQILRDGGIEEAGTDARILCAALLGLDRARLLTEGGRILSAEESAAIDDAIMRRAGGEPVARILGKKEFWSMEFAVNGATLIPRADSETLIDAVLALYPDRRAPLRILDLGTGTGCLLLALLGEFPFASGIGTDIAPEAVALAGQNAERLGFKERAEFKAGDWADGIAAPFDLIISNPPYIPNADIAALDRDVRDYDPLLALDGGADGLDAYRALAKIIPGLLKSGGHAVIEIGYDQGLSAADIFTKVGFPPPKLRRDLGGQPRCLVVAHVT
ncbi:MAG: peptide chain release factor N(5)-glutamine methyltransferase [Alphaproteobacteria bacterium]